MMNLKTYLDAVQAANEEVKRVAMEIDTAFTSESEDGVSQAMAMRPVLDAAQNKAQAALEFYGSMKSAIESIDSNAAKFVPVNAATEKPEDSRQMTRAQFEALSPKLRFEYLGKGGVLVDEIQE